MDLRVSCEVGGGKGRILITISWERDVNLGGLRDIETPLLSLRSVHSFLVFQNLGLLSKFRSVACQAAVLAQFSFQMQRHVFQWYYEELSI